MKPPFETIWADIGDAETDLLTEILGDAEKLHARLRSNREAGRPDHYAEHMALTVMSRTRALLRLSPHRIENFQPEQPA